MKELASGAIPVVVTFQVLKLSRQPYYRWPPSPVTGRDIVQAYRANALHDTHLEDPEFGYRFLADQANTQGEVMCGRTAWRLCHNQGWWSAFGKKKARPKGKRPDPLVRDDQFAEWTARWTASVLRTTTRQGRSTPTEHQTTTNKQATLAS